MTSSPTSARTSPHEPSAVFARRALAELQRLAPDAELPGIEILDRPPAVRATRLLAAADGWWALTLARPSDLELVPAVICSELDGRDEWHAIESWASPRRASDAVDRCQLLGIAAAALPSGSPDEQLVARGTQLGSASRPRVEVSRSRQPVVVDLSSLWAGPLAGHLLELTGAEVIKVESPQRPDGMRLGSPGHYQDLNAGKLFVELDLAAPSGRSALLDLFDSADVVIESSRPRALQQLGIDASSIVASRPGLTWVSITAYGRTGPWSNRVGFGDDVAAAAGLVSYGPHGVPAFAGDALADPLAGVHAAAAALASFHGGGGELVDVAMREVALAARLAWGGELRASA